MKMGKKIKLLRVEQDLFQEELAKKVGVTDATISKAERGLSDGISIPTIKQIAIVLGVSYDWLVDESQGYPPLERVEKKRERRRKQEV